VQALRANGRLNRALPFVPRQMAALTGGVMAHASAGAILLVMLVHAVETAKFITAWTDYKAAVRALAMGAASDPALGDPHFVSSDRRLEPTVLVFDNPFPVCARGSRICASAARSGSERELFLAFLQNCLGEPRGRPCCPDAESSARACARMPASVTLRCPGEHAFPNRVSGVWGNLIAEEHYRLLKARASRGPQRPEWRRSQRRPR
jgi:hypothetical protein